MTSTLPMGNCINLGKKCLDYKTINQLPNLNMKIEHEATSYAIAKKKLCIFFKHRQHTVFQMEHIIFDMVVKKAAK